MKKQMIAFLVLTILSVAVGWNDYVPFIAPVVFYILAFIFCFFFGLTILAHYAKGMYEHVED